MSENPTQRKRVAAVIGGAVAGAETARALAERGIGVVVFEQNARPYGKIEDGLPRWHEKLRDREYERINENLTLPGVDFVPRTAIGRDVAFEALASEWGFSCVFLANGAWRDRSLGLPGVEDYIGRGFYYQNPFIYWFNHYPEASYDGPRCEAAEGAVVVGGGLASIDVVKALMLETVARKLQARGIASDPVSLEHQGVDKALAAQGLTLETLGVTPCTLCYRRTASMMPLQEYKENATPEQRAKTEQTRVKLLQNGMQKYLFRFQELVRPTGILVEASRMVGLRFIRTRVDGSKVVDVPGSEHEVRSPLTISSVGSIPMPIPGIAMDGELYRWRDWDRGELAHEAAIFGVGNVITGKGNIAVSRRHARDLTDQVAARYLGVGNQAPTELPGEAELRAEAEARAEVADRTLPELPESVRQALGERVRARQREVGYDRDYHAWIARVTPPDRG
jgi:NADPH-dependent glutamate synthase beta subunit-like oxidoreductase